MFGLHDDRLDAMRYVFDMLYKHQSLWWKIKYHLRKFKYKFLHIKLHKKSRIRGLHFDSIVFDELLKSKE